jgi:hypothetical protein
MLVNVTMYPTEAMPPEERDLLGLLELDDEAEPPLSRDDAFGLIEGRLFQAVWLDDDFPW